MNEDVTYAIKGLKDLKFYGGSKELLVINSDNIEARTYINKNKKNDYGYLSILIRDYSILDKFVQVADKLKNIKASYHGDLGYAVYQNNEKGIFDIELFNVSIKSIKFDTVIEIIFDIYPNEEGCILDIKKRREKDDINIDYIFNEEYIINEKYDKELLGLGFKFNPIVRSLEKNINYNGNTINIGFLRRGEKSKIEIRKIDFGSFINPNVASVYDLDINEDIKVTLSKLKYKIDSYLLTI